MNDYLKTLWNISDPTDYDEFKSTLTDLPDMMGGGYNTLLVQSYGLQAIMAIIGMMKKNGVDYDRLITQIRYADRTNP